LLTGPQLQSLLVPVSQFPSDYEVENEIPSNSGPSFLDVPYALGCSDFPDEAGVGASDLGSAAAASDSLWNDQDTAEFSEGIFEFWNQGQAVNFFTKGHDLYGTCYTDVQDVKNVLRSSDVDGLRAFAETETQGGTETADKWIETTLFSVKGVNVYFAGVYSPNSDVLPTVPSLSSLIKQLVAHVDAYHK
jgi:hypothetical protein